MASLLAAFMAGIRGWGVLFNGIPRVFHIGIDIPPLTHSHIQTHLIDVAMLHLPRGTGYSRISDGEISSPIRNPVIPWVETILCDNWDLKIGVEKVIS